MVERMRSGSDENDPTNNRVDKSLSTKVSAKHNTRSMSSDDMARFLLLAYKTREDGKRPELDWFLDEYESDFDKAKFMTRWRSQERSARRLAENFPQPTIEGKALETFLSVEIDTAKWFGDTTVTPTVFSDDVHNKVDAVIEWLDGEKDQEPFRLAVDYSTSGLDERIHDKLKVKHSNGAKVDFLYSDAEPDDPVKTMYGLPRIVIGIDAQLIGEVGREASGSKKMVSVKVEKDGGNRYEDRPKIPKDAYVDHPLQLMLLDQAAVQMDLHVRNLANKISDKLAKSHRESPLQGIDLIEVRAAIESALNEKIKNSKVDELVEVIDGILRDHPTQSGNIIGESGIAKWKNWSGCRRKIVEKRRDVLEKISTPDRDTARSWEKRSNLHGAVHEFVRQAA
jgi:hypothetical protein